MKTQSFEQLIVWQKAHQFVLAVYKTSKDFPKEELFGLTSQLRRAAISITANIAEGYVSIGSKEKLRFFNIAQGSLEETRNFIILSKDLGYISPEIKEQLTIHASEVSRILNAYCTGIIKQKEVPQLPNSSNSSNSSNS